MNLKQEAGTSPDSLVVTGGAKSGCSVPVDITLSLRWLDGPERQTGERAFAVLARVQPGETRPFSEVVSGGRGGTRVVVSGDAAAAPARRR